MKNLKLKECLNFITTKVNKNVTQIVELNDFELVYSNDSETYTIKTENILCKQQGTRLDLKQLKSFKADKLEIDGSVYKSDGIQFTTKDLSYEVEYPKINVGYKEGESIVATIEMDELLKVSHAMGKNDIRYYLNGLFFDIDNIVATDGHRLSYVSHGINIPNDTTLDSIVPEHIISAAIKAAKKQKLKTIDFIFNKDYTKIKAGCLTIATKNIDGRFPNYKRVIPQELDNSIEIHRKDFINTITKIKPFLDRKYGGIALEIKDSFINLYSKDGGELLTKISYIKTGNDEHDHKIGLNADYLLDALKSKKETLVLLEYNDQFSSILLGGNTVIMPMRL